VSQARRSSRAKAPDVDLFGQPLRARLPLRKVVERPDGRGFDIAVREPACTNFRHLGAVYSTRGEAWQAVRDGVGLEPRESREEIHVSVYFSATRRPR